MKKLTLVHPDQFMLRAPAKGFKRENTIRLIRKNVKWSQDLLLVDPNLLCFETVIEVAYENLSGNAGLLHSCLRMLLFKMTRYCEYKDLENILSFLRWTGGSPPDELTGSILQSYKDAEKRVDAGLVDLLSLSDFSAFAIRQHGYVRKFLAVLDDVSR